MDYKIVYSKLTEEEKKKYPPLSKNDLYWYNKFKKEGEYIDYLLVEDPYTKKKYWYPLGD